MSPGTQFELLSPGTQFEVLIVRENVLNPAQKAVLVLYTNYTSQINRKGQELPTILQLEIVEYIECRSQYAFGILFEFSSDFSRKLK